MSSKAIEELIKRSPLAVIVIGVIVFIIGAAGRLPIGDNPLLITDPVWRAALGVMGLILLSVGVLLLLRDSSETVNNPIRCTYGIRITSPRSGEQVGEWCEVVGTYTTKPPQDALRLLVLSLDGRSIWPQDFVPELGDGTWRGRVRLGIPRYSAVVTAVIVGQSSQDWLRYYFKVGQTTQNWVPLDAPLPHDMVGCAKVTIERV